MSLVINWIDRNITVDKFRVYRANSVILDAALPAVLAEVPAGTFSYTDATAVRNQVYHYRVGVVANGEETLSSNIALAYMPNTGPGPQKLLRGDWSFGTFGRMPLEDLFGASDLVTLCGLNPAMVAASNIAKWWIKLVYNNKILFVPDLSISNGGYPLSWVDLYKAGLVYGADDPSTWSAAAKTAYGVIPQNFQVTKGADTFVVRLPGTRVGTLGATAVPANHIGGEYDMIFSPLYTNRSLQLNPIQLDDVVYGANAQGYTKDHTTLAGDTMIHRPDATAIPDAVGTWAMAYAYVYTAWRPVLELVF